MTQIKITKTKAGKYRVKYYGANGEMLANSEVLNSRQAARKNIAAMQWIFLQEFPDAEKPKVWEIK